MNFQKVPEGRPLRMAVIGAGNRANKYLEYARRHPERLQPVAVVDGNELRRNETAERFGLAAERRYADYDAFFARPADADAVLITTPDDVHFDPCMKAIDAGLHVLLEKPIAQRLDECRAIARRARERGVLVGICHVLRYHPYFAKIREIVDSGELGQIISVNHVAAVGIDRTTHSYVRGPWRREETSNPMLLAKCCHDVDFLLWITRSPCRKLSSFGSLRWFRAANAPQTSTERCIDCPVEHDCPYSAVDLYCTRRDWISNFDVPQGRTLDEVLLEELRHGPYGRCIYRCDNDVVDHQLLTMELADETILSLSMDIFTQDDCRRTHIKDDARRDLRRRTQAPRASLPPRPQPRLRFRGVGGAPLPCGRRPAADRRFRRRADPPRPPFPLHDRGFDREPPHLFRGRAQPPLRRNDPAGITSEGHGTVPPRNRMKRHPLSR